MRKFIVIAILLLSGTVAGAQRVLIKNIYVDGRMYYSAEIGKERQNGFLLSEFEDDKEFEQNTHIFNIGVSLKFEYKNN